jgi:hypothetical protein
MDTQRDNKMQVPPVKRKPIGSREAPIMFSNDEPRPIEPAGEPLLFREENGSENAAKAFSHQKQPVNAVEIAPPSNTTTMLGADQGIMEKNSSNDGSSQKQNIGWKESTRRLVAGDSFLRSQHCFPHSFNYYPEKV